MTQILNRYFLKQFIITLILVFAAIISVVLAIDSVEQLRQAASREHVDFKLEFLMILYKFPHLSESLIFFPFIIGSFIAFRRFSFSQEFLIMRTSGISVAKFLSLPLVFTFGAGLFITFILNPLATKSYAKYQHIKYTYAYPELADQQKNWIWLKQIDKAGYKFIYGHKINSSTLAPAIVFSYTFEDKLIERLDAKEAVLSEGLWTLMDVKTTNNKASRTTISKISFPTDHTYSSLNQNQIPPKAMSILDLPGVIKSLKSQNLQTSRYAMRFQSLLAIPFLLCGLVMCSAAFGLRMINRGGLIFPIFTISTIGFSLFVFRNILIALAHTNKFPILLSAWLPAFIMISLGLGLLLHFEETA